MYKRQALSGRKRSLMYRSDKVAHAISALSVSYTHLDVYKRQLGKDAERFGSWLEINYMADVAGNAEAQKDQILAAYHKTWDQIYETNENAGDQGFNGILECRSSEVDSFRTVFS